MRTCLLAIAFLLPLAAAADESAERGELQKQRAAIEARFTADSEGCQHRFAVNDCMDKLRRQRAAELRPLLQREQELDARQRRARAEEQRERVAQKQREFEAEEARRLSELVAAPEPASAPRRLTPDPRTPRGSAQVHGEAVQAEIAAAEREAQRRVEQTAARERAAREHQQSVQRREAQRAKEGKKPAAPLPLPSAAEVAAISASVAPPAKPSSAASAPASAPRR